MTRGSWIQDITQDANGKQRLSQSELQRLHELGITISDTETTGLSRGLSGLSEFASIKATQADDGFHLQLLHSFTLPLRPEYQDYLAECETYQAALQDYKTARATARRKHQPKPEAPTPPYYDRKRYEYDINPQALAVTGTEFLRESLDGPIIGMRVLDQYYMAEGKEPLAPKPAAGHAYPFYETWPHIREFTRKGQGDVYYNTPFDKPFLAELIRDVQAYDLASSDIQLEHDGNDTIVTALREKAPHLLDLPYDQANESERTQLLTIIREALSSQSQYSNPSQYQCLLFSFMKARGIGQSNRLDDAYRQVVDTDYRERGEHSAIEDICMAAQVGTRLSDDFGGTIPTMQQLFGRLAQAVDPNATVTPSTPRNLHSNGKKTNDWIEGDLSLHFSKPLHEFGEKGIRLERFLNAFEKVTERNSRAPRHFLQHPNPQDYTINAERKQPLSLNFLKKWMLFDQLTQHPVVEGFYPFDSTGTRIDARLRQSDASGEPVIIEDTHYSSLRANLDFLASHQQQAADCLRFIAAVRKSDRRIGVVLLRENAAHTGYQMILKGHLRQLGDVTIDLPAENPFATEQPALFRQLDRLLKLGVIPFVGSLEQIEETLDNPAYDSESTTDEAAEDVPHTPPASAALSMQQNQLTLAVKPLIMQLIALQLHQPLDLMLRKGEIQTRQHPIKLHYQSAQDSYMLSGDIDAFWDFVHAGITPEEENGLSEKPSSLIRNASWMLYRLQQIPGTYGVRIEPPMVILDQPDGVSIEAMHLLHRSGIPCKFYDRSIKIDAQQLMQDAFHWSQRISRLQDERKADQEKPTEQQTLAPPAFLQLAHRALISHQAEAVEMDELQQCWMLDGSAGTAGKMRHYLLDPRAQTPDSWHHKNRIIDPATSPVQGQQRIQIDRQPDGTYVTMTPVIHAALLASREQAHQPLPEATRLPNGHWRVALPSKQTKTALREIESIAAAIYDLHKITGKERLPATSIQLTNHQSLLVTLPDIRLFSHRTLLTEMMDLHQHLTQGDLDAELKILRKRIPSTDKLDPRREDLWLLCDQLVKETTHIAAASKQLVGLLERTSGYEGSDNHALNYVGRIRHDLGNLGLLVHELSSDLHDFPLQKMGNISDKNVLRKKLQDVHTVREKLFRYSTASERLDEAALVLIKALTGSKKSRHNSLQDQIASSLLYLVDAQAFEQGDLSSDFALSQSMQHYESTLQSLFGEQAESFAARIRPAYEQRASDILSRLERAGPAAKDLSRVARYLLRHVHPDWSTEQTNAVISLYTHGTDNDSLEQARKRLLPHFPLTSSRSQPDSVESLLTQRQLRYQEYIAPHDSLPDDTQQKILQTIQEAYLKRAGRYLTLLGKPLDEQLQEPDHTEQERITHNAAHCLSMAGKNPQAIDAAITKAQHTRVKRKAYLHAWREVMNPAPPLSENIADQLRVIDLPEREAHTTELLTAKWRKAQQREEQKLTAALADPHAEFKQRKALMRSMQKALGEIHDLQMVKLHAIRDLAAAILQLQYDPQQFSQLPSDISARIAPIMNSISEKPEATGITAQAMHSTGEYRDTVLQQIDLNTRNALDQAHINYTWHSATRQFEIPLNEIGKWLSYCSPDLTVTSPPNTSSHTLLPVDYPAAIRYASHLQLGMHAPDLTLHIDLPARGHTDTAKARLHIQYSGLPDARQQQLLSLCVALAAHQAEKAMRFDTYDDHGSLDIPMDRLCLTMTLISMATRFSAIEEVENIAYDNQTGGLSLSLRVPESQPQREVLEGKIALIAFAMPLDPVSYVPLMQAEAGSTLTLSFTPTAELQQGITPSLQHATRNDVLTAARDYGKQHHMPTSARTRMIEEIRAMDPAHPPSTFVWLTGKEKSANASHKGKVADRSKKPKDEPQR